MEDTIYEKNSLPWFTIIIWEKMYDANGYIGFIRGLSPSRRRETPCEGTNSPRLFTPGETKALAKSKVHQ